MSNRKFFRLGSIPLLVAGLAMPLMTQGCDQLECSDAVGVKLARLEIAVNALDSAAASMRAELALACDGIATDMGTTRTDLPDPNMATDDDIKVLCDEATLLINGAIQAGATIQIAIEGGGCTVDANAQFQCEGACDINGECTPGSIEARCTPGDLSVECSGSCQATATCQGTATVAAQCEGSCEGTCNGMCDGSASNGTKCNGVCEGTCTGDCKLAANASINCGANVRCKGGCDVQGTAPKCEATIEGPDCNIDAQCNAACEGEASFKAECTEPTIVVTGDANATVLITALNNNFGHILNVLEYALLAGEAGVKVAGNLDAAADALGDTVGCALQAVGNVDIGIQASVSVTASASASGSVNGAATGS